MSFIVKATHTLCIAREYSPNKRVFTPVGVGWINDKGRIKAKLDITVVLGPNDELYLFPKDLKPEESE